MLYAIFRDLKGSVHWPVTFSGAESLSIVQLISP